MRVLSYNIHKGIGGRDRRYRLERIIRVIEDHNPDIVCLQEVDRHVARSHHDDQPRKLSDALRAAEHLYQLNVRVKDGGYGNLVLSRWPFRCHHQVSLRQRRRKPRGAQMAVVETPEGPFHLVHWHLGLAERERHWQVRHLLEHCAVSRVGAPADVDRRRLQRLAQHAGPGPVRAARLRAGDGAAVAVPLVPGVHAGRLAGQGVRARARWISATRGSPARGWPAMPPTTCRSSSISTWVTGHLGKWTIAGRSRLLQGCRSPAKSRGRGSGLHPAPRIRRSFQFGFALSRLSTSPCSSASVRAPLTARAGKVPSGVSSR